MLRRLFIAVGIFIAAVGTWAAETPRPLQTNSNAGTTQSSSKLAKAKSHSLHKNGKKKKVEKVEPAPPPPPPPTLEQQPAVAPEVSYRAGMLTITARNSTMNDVLNAVRRVTSASIDRPAGTGSERVVGTFGPGAPKDVLSQLLNGSRYDYIILGSATRPGGIDRVMLTVRSNAAPASAVASGSPAPNQANPALPNNNSPASASDDEEASPESDMEPETAPEPDQQAGPPQEEPQGVPIQPPQGVPPQTPPDRQNPNQQNPNQAPNQPQVKTPEELLRELQQMQQQQQQQQPPPQ